jgi:hypothetical protein
MADNEKVQGAVHKEHMGDVDVIQTVHQDGTVDYVDTHAIGGDLEKMPSGYFYSVQFIGTVTVSLPRRLKKDGTDLILIGCLLCEYLCLLGLGLACKYSVSSLA